MKATVSFLYQKMSNRENISYSTFLLSTTLSTVSMIMKVSQVLTTIHMAVNCMKLNLITLFQCGKVLVTPKGFHIHMSNQQEAEEEKD